MKNSSDTIGNRTRDFPTCSAGPQPTALRRAPQICKSKDKKSTLIYPKSPEDMRLKDSQH